MRKMLPKSVWRVCLVLIGLVAAVAVADVVSPHISPTLAVPADNGGRHPVLVELFTSEGCSSCPPADNLLARLDTEQFIPGAQAIVLSEHVTYWNHDGWSDPYSFDGITERQDDYRRRFNLDSSFTPQAVIDGETQVVGNDQANLVRAVEKAAAEPSLDLLIADAVWSGSAVHFKVRVASGSMSESLNSRSLGVTAVLAEDSAQTAVKSGENAGRTLRHVAVVRTLGEMGKGALEGRDLTLKVPGAAGRSGAIRLVVFAVDRHSGHVVGVAEQRLTR